MDQLGSGGIGEVYRVADQDLNGQIIALKVLRAGLAADEATFQRFRNEVFVARALVHPNLVRIFDIGKAPEGYSFITMELVEGVSLKALLDEGNLYAGGSNQTVRQGRITGIDQLVALYEQLLEGVAYAHSQGVIHRDLKPANILLGKNGAIKLLDFGTARFVESDLNLTQSGQLVGTPLYMAPEQIRGEKLDARCDVYALGLIGYEIATGKRPFAAEDVMSAMYNHLQESIPTFASASNGIPPWYEAIIFRACHKNRAERFEDAGDLLNAIRQRKIPGAEKRTSKGRIGAALMGLLVVGVCSVLALRQRENLPPQPAVIEQTTQRESPAMDIPDELLEEQAKVEQTTQSSVSSSDSAAPTPLATATPPAPSIPQVISTGVLPRTEEPTPSGTPSLVPSPVPCPRPSPTARVEPEVEKASVADISLRDSKSTVPATEFDADAVSDVRALAIVSDAGALGRSSQSVAASSKFAIRREGSGELIRTFPVRILSEPIEGRDELRLGANLHDVPGLSLSPGTYRLELLLDGKALGVLHFSVFPLR